MSRDVRHPGQKYYTIAYILLALTVLFSFISIFVPWAWKDIAPYLRIYAYPFKNCVEVTDSPLNAESCQDNDFSAEDSVSGGNVKCRGFIIATIVFVVITVILGVITLILFAILLWRLWSRPWFLAIIVQLCLFVIFSSALLAWIMWIVYSETLCKESVLFPVSGYSYGFVLHVFASFLAFLAVILAYIGLYKTLTFRPCEEHFFHYEQQPCYELAAAPCSPWYNPAPIDNCAYGELAAHRG